MLSSYLGIFAEPSCLLHYRERPVTQLWIATRRCGCRGACIRLKPRRNRTLKPALIPLEGSMATLRLGLIGSGDIVRKRFAPALRDLANCELLAVSRAQPALAEAFAQAGLPSRRGA